MMPFEENPTHNCTTFHPTVILTVPAQICGPNEASEPVPHRPGHRQVYLQDNEEGHGGV